MEILGIGIVDNPNPTPFDPFAFLVIECAFSTCMHTCVRLIIRVQTVQGVGGRTCNDVTCMNAVVSLQCRSVVGLLYELDPIYELLVNEERCLFH